MINCIVAIHVHFASPDTMTQRIALSDPNEPFSGPPASVVEAPRLSQEGHQERFQGDEALAKKHKRGDWEKGEEATTDADT